MPRVRPGVLCVADHVFTIEAGHRCLDGHFPGAPIVPGVILLDHVARAQAFLVDGRAVDDGARAAAEVLEQDLVVLDLQLKVTPRTVRIGQLGGGILAATDQQCRAIFKRKCTTRIGPLCHDQLQLRHEMILSVRVPRKSGDVVRPKYLTGVGQNKQPAAGNGGRATSVTGRTPGHRRQPARRHPR